MNIKNISKLLAVALVSGGCVSREPVVHHYETKIINSDGTEEIQYGACAGNEKQFTVIGNVWNGATYGVMGCGYMAYQKCLDGITSTNNVPVIGPVANGAWGLTSGAVEGLCDGSLYGVQMKYGESPTFEEIVADQVQTNALKAKQFTEKYIPSNYR